MGEFIYEKRLKLGTYIFLEMDILTGWPGVRPISALADLRPAVLVPR